MYVWRSDVIELVKESYYNLAESMEDVWAMLEDVEKLPSAQPERQWYPCASPPEHHKDVLVRGVEAIGNVTVHKVMQWDVDRWRPENYATSIIWKEWCEI